MTRRLVLVSLDWLRPKDPRVSLGHASLQARLALESDLEVVPVACAINDLSFDPRALLADIVAVAVPGSEVAVGVYVWNEQVVQWLLPALRKAGFSGRIILGGPQITYAPAGVLDVYPDADVVIRGYGEDALAAVVGQSAPGHRRGVTYRGAPDVTDPAETDLLALPSPILSGIATIQPFMRWETQRGCVYACSFCQHRESGARLRQRVLEEKRIHGEIDALVSGGARDIAVLDPIFHSNPASVDILRLFAASAYSGRLSLQSRFESIDEVFLDACSELHVRLEFGLQTTNRGEMVAVNRMNDLRKADAVIRKLHARAIPFEVSLIYGLPTQTVASFEESVRWCLERGVPVVRAFPLMLLRGTGLARDRHRWGLVESDDVIPVVVESDSFSRQDWHHMRNLADDLDAFGPARWGVA